MSEEAGSTGGLEGLVAAVYARRCRVWSGGRLWECTIAARLLRGGRLVVGDRVTLMPQPDGTAVVSELLPRQSLLVRPRADRSRRGPAAGQVLAANVALLAIVAAIRSPPYRIGLVERFLVAAAKAGLRPLVVLTKLDLDEGGEFAQLERELTAIGVPVLGTRLDRPDTLTPLKQALAGSINALVGHSGVGKTSLINAIADTELAVSEVNPKRDRGRHTTSTARLIPLPGEGWVIDSPGVREFGLDDITPADLAAYFPGMAPHLGRCAFGDCLHHTEGRCGVREAVEAGEFPEARYRGYLKLLEELEQAP
ncbi:MAG: ribosome small subunit-dependent GTPase A [bacterium]